MSRSGYTDELDDNLAYGRWRAQVASSIRGKRGQKLLKDLAEAMDAMPKKKLISNKLQQGDNFCALGVLGHKRGLELSLIDPEDSACVASHFDIAEPLAREIVSMNDEYCEGMTPAKRWSAMRKWVADNLKKSTES